MQLIETTKNFELNLLIYFKKNINKKIMSEVKSKNIPKHIPKENVYMTAHWMVYVSYACLLGSLYLLINGAFFG